MIKTDRSVCLLTDDKRQPLVYGSFTELDRENPDFPLYLISHGQKIGLSRVLLAMCWEVADCMCAASHVWSTKCGRNISALKVAQSYSDSLRALFGKDLTQPNFCSITDSAIICGGIGSPGSPCLILWAHCIAISWKWWPTCVYIHLLVTGCYESFL